MDRNQPQTLRYLGNSSQPHGPCSRDVLGTGKRHTVFHQTLSQPAKFYKKYVQDYVPAHPRTVFIKKGRKQQWTPQLKNHVSKCTRQLVALMSSSHMKMLNSHCDFHITRHILCNFFLSGLAQAYTHKGFQHWSRSTPNMTFSFILNYTTFEIFCHLEGALIKSNLHKLFLYLLYILINLFS